MPDDNTYQYRYDQKFGAPGQADFNESQRRQSRWHDNHPSSSGSRGGAMGPFSLRFGFFIPLMIAGLVIEFGGPKILSQATVHHLIVGWYVALGLYLLIKFWQFALLAALVFGGYQACSVKKPETTVQPREAVVAAPPVAGKQKKRPHRPTPPADANAAR